MTANPTVHATTLARAVQPVSIVTLARNERRTDPHDAPLKSQEGISHGTYTQPEL